MRSNITRSKYVWGLLALLLLGGAAAYQLTPRPRVAHPGFSAPLRLDSTPIKIKIGNTRYAIPANYFDGPLEPKGKDGEYTVIVAFLLRGLLPEFEGWNAGNSDEFMTRGWGRRVSFLVSLPGVPTQVGLQRNRDRVLGANWPERANDPISDGGVIVLELSNDGYGSDKQDAFVSKSTGHYTICNRVQSPRVPW